MDSAEFCFKLRKEFGDWDDSFDEPSVKNCWGSHGKYRVVGNEKVTNENCGKYRGLRGCLRDDLHDIIASDGKNHKGEVFIKKVYFSCDKPSCPICFKYGWAVREAGKIELRLEEVSKRFGVVEHIVVSVPAKDYGLTYKCLRRKVIKILYGCGIVGGVMIFHGFRYNVRKNWFWSIHFHVLGFILGGYSRCRHCKGGDCYACDGHEGKFYRAYRSDGYSKGYIVKVMGERKKSYVSDKPNVFGTAWYQLNHATIDVTKKRFHVATWFGVCSYRKLKVTVKRRRGFCPICESDLEWVRFNGNRFVMDENLHSDKRCFFANAVGEDGRRTYVKNEGYSKYV